MRRHRKVTTHKIITNAVHFACLAAAVYIFAVWRRGTVMDAPQMLQYIAWIEITNLTQYSAKSGYEHSKGIFDNSVAEAATQGMQTGDLSQAAQVEQAATQKTESAGSQPDQGSNSNMAG